MMRPLLLAWGLVIAACTPRLDQQAIAKDVLTERGFTEITLQGHGMCPDRDGIKFVGTQPNGTRIEGVVCGDEIETTGKIR